MCGICGLFLIDRPPEGVGSIVLRMADSLVRRGPDDHGAWWDDEVGVALGHRRLAVIDLSPAGRQPMVSPSSRYVITFNGEIYNYRHLRRELSPFDHASDGDTAVMLAAFDQWGIAGAVDRFEGMFAFGVWDRRDRVLTLVRDRFGVKPLYYHRSSRIVAFASELSSFGVVPGLRLDLRRDALRAYLRYGYVPSPYSIYESIEKLPQGSMVSFPLTGGARAGTVAPVRYWSASQAALAAQADPISCGDDEAVELVESALDASIRLRLVADVPVGSFLSGGVDSSLVTALLQRAAGRPVKSFTIGFDEPSYDESPYAAKVARHLGTDHTEVRLTSREALAVVPLLASIFDKPFADSSQIPTYLVSQVARAQVTVTLSGDGGDELFGGYNRYLWMDMLWRALRPVPDVVRRAASGILTRIDTRILDGAYHWSKPILPKSLRFHNVGGKVRRFAELLPVRDSAALYERLITLWDDPRVVRGAIAEGDAVPTRPDGIGDLIGSLMRYETETYLPDDILVKLDRATMAVSLEAREPLLDRALFELAWRLPPRMKVRDGEGKWILKKVLLRHLPHELVARPKMGFAVPIGHWLRGPLREWAEDLLNPRRLEEGGVFDPAIVGAVWQEHCVGVRNRESLLWAVLMFESWRTQRGGASG